MKKFLKPALFLLEKLRYPYKLGLVSAVLLLPLAILSYFVVTETNGEIAKEQWKLLGIRAIYTIEMLARAVGEREGGVLYAASTLEGRKNSASENSAEIVNALDRIDHDFGRSLGTADNWLEIKARLAKVAGKSREARRTIGGNAELSAALDAFLRKTGESSGLMLDTEYVTHYLIETVVFNLPRLIENSGKLMSLGGGSLDRRKFTAADKIQLAQLSGKIQNDESLLESNLRKTFLRSSQVETEISPIFSDSQKVLSRFLHEVVSGMLADNGRPFDLRNVYQRGSVSIEKAYRLSNSLLSVLDREETQRISQLELRRNMVFAAALLAAGAAFYFLLGFTVMLMEHLRLLLHAAKQVSTAGNFDFTVNIAARDEMAIIAASFNDMTASMKRMIAEVRNEEEKERESEAKYRAVVEQAEDAILLTDLDGNILEANKSAEKMLGYSKKEFLKMKTSAFSGAGQNLQAHGVAERQEFRLCKKDGSEIHIEISGTMIEYCNRKERLAIFRDVTQRKQMEDQLHLVAKVIENAAESIMITDGEGSIIATNGAFTDMTGFYPIEVLGKKPSILKSERHGDEFFQEMWNSLLFTGRWQGEIWDRRKSGEEFPAWLSINVVADADGVAKNYVGIFSDISQIKESQKKVEFMANYDALTGIPNRNFFAVRLKQCIAHAERKKEKFGLMFIDLDNFKPINDTLGHDAGDMLLQHVSIRLKECIREEDTVARLGGDEFAMIFNPYKTDSMAHTAQRVIEKLSHQFDLAGNEVKIGSSIGIAIYPVDGQDSETLLKNADTAMYKAKQGGKNDYRFYSSGE